MVSGTMAPAPAPMVSGTMAPAPMPVTVPVPVPMPMSTPVPRLFLETPAAGPSHANAGSASSDSLMMLVGAVGFFVAVVGISFVVMRMRRQAPSTSEEQVGPQPVASYEQVSAFE